MDGKTRLLSEAAYGKIEREIVKFPAGKKRSAAIAAMVIAQEEAGWLSPEIMAEIAAYLEVPLVAIQEIASFYSLFDTRPVGKYKISVCSNLPCELAGGGDAARHLKSRLGIAFGETTPDGYFTLVEGECMGSCGDGPVLLVNNKRMHIRMSNDKIDRLLEDLKR
ncbi:MAG: NADH-quinone oxidoreductase subunit NuoE [Burkholderiaceae bacterium]|jgi:NADH-quinone oxidoreductase subunit E|nr:NADH-quinone oxidoreductase subunit NuoE [Burkholderiaceae bacterium]